MRDHQDLQQHALGIVAGANIASRDECLEAAASIEKEGINGYYDDAEGCGLLVQIAAYYRSKAGSSTKLWERAEQARLGPNLVALLRSIVEDDWRKYRGVLPDGAVAIMRRLRSLEAPPELIQEVAQVLDSWLRG